MSENLASGHTVGSVALPFAPAALEFTVAPDLLRVLVLERLHLPFPSVRLFVKGPPQSGVHENGEVE